MDTTRKDFWQLVWDANCSTIVTLGDQHWVSNIFGIKTVTNINMQNQVDALELFIKM